MSSELKNICSNFRIPGAFQGGGLYGNGHINTTYKVYFSDSGKVTNYILQKINTGIFKNPFNLMDNIKRVTDFQQKKLTGLPDAERRSLILIKAQNDDVLYNDQNGGFWRCYLFIEDALTYEIMESKSLAFNAAKAFGEFQKMLKDLPSSNLHITIPDFHNTPKRYAAFESAVNMDIDNRVRDVKDEIEFILSRQHYADKLIKLHENGLLPERSCHYDTKLNNVLMDSKTKEGICVIDLDTIMPGFTAFDFGDLIRTATSPAAEDERDVSKVRMQLDIFEGLAEGFLSATSDFLTKEEKNNLAFGGLLVTLENAVRFLTDHLQKDVYFKIHRPGHNLDRCRTQIALVKSIEQQIDKMNNIINRLVNG